jgi:hypothetical protein
MKRKIYFSLLAFVLLFSNNLFSQTYHDLSAGSFSQNWTNTGLITTNDNWTGVPSIIGYRGDNLTATQGADPQLILADSLRQDVNANKTNSNSFTTGGVTEFEFTNPVVAIKGSGTADAPSLVFYLNSSNVTSVTFQCNLRDLDDTINNAIQPIAFQYRIGTTGNFTNIPTAFVADASAGPSLTLVTPVSFTLPATCDNQSQIQIRVITTNAVGVDEWIGIDDVVIYATTASAPTKLAVTSINGGTDPYVNTGFYAVVKSLDASDIASNVTADLNYTITLATGAGVLGGTLTGTILAGTSVDTIFGITYNTVETGVSITATDNAAGLTAGTSALFNVQALPPTAVKLSITNVNNGIDPYVGATFTATVKAWDNSNNPVNVVAPVNITLSAIYGTGTLGGTIIGTIASGKDSVTITGVTYNTAENAIALKVIDDASTLIADTSVLFNVLAIPAAPALVITEIMYDSPESGNDSLEFIELFNNGSTAIPVKNMTFTTGVVYTFKNDTVQPGAYYLVCIDSVAFSNFYGVTARQWTSGALTNTTGEAITLKDSFGHLVDSVYYKTAAPWPTAPHGTGPSLMLCDPTLDNNIGANWFAAAEFVDSLNHIAVYATPGTGCIITSITENKEEVSTSIYPNPANDQVTVSNIPAGVKEIRIFDVAGNMINSIALNNRSSITIDMIALPKGVYLLNMIDEKNTTSVHKIIKL